MSFGTWLYTKMHGDKVGEDDHGNVYYRSKTRKRWGNREQRWVVYKGEPEASKVPPEWQPNKDIFSSDLKTGRTKE